MVYGNFLTTMNLRSGAPIFGTAEQWTDDGALDMQQRANRQWKQMLADYEPPPIDDAVDRELRAFVDDRKRAMPDAWY